MGSSDGAPDGTSNGHDAITLKRILFAFCLFNGGGHCGRRRRQASLAGRQSVGSGRYSHGLHHASDGISIEIRSRAVLSRPDLNELGRATWSRQCAVHGIQRLQNAISYHWIRIMLSTDVQAIFNEIIAFALPCFADYPIMKLDDACTTRP